jgi:hypothetical protein
VKQDERWLKAGLEMRAMRKSLGHSWLAADEIIRAMRALRESLPAPKSTPALPESPTDEPPEQD